MNDKFIIGYSIYNNKIETKIADSSWEVSSLESHNATILYLSRTPISKSDSKHCKKAIFTHCGTTKAVFVYGYTDTDMLELLKQAYGHITDVKLEDNTSGHKSVALNDLSTIIIFVILIIIGLLLPIFIILNLFGAIEPIKKLIAKIRKREYKKKTVVRTPFGKKMRIVAIVCGIISEISLITAILLLVLNAGASIPSTVLGIFFIMPIIYDGLYFILKNRFNKVDKLYESVNLGNEPSTPKKKNETLNQPTEQDSIESVTTYKSIIIEKIFIGNHEFQKSEIEQLFALIWIRGYNKFNYEEANDKIVNYLSENEVIDRLDISISDIENILAKIWAKKINDLGYEEAINKIVSLLTTKTETRVPVKSKPLRVNEEKQEPSPEIQPFVDSPTTVTTNNDSKTANLPNNKEDKPKNNKTKRHSFVGSKKGKIILSVGSIILAAILVIAIVLPVTDNFRKVRMQGVLYYLEGNNSATVIGANNQRSIAIKDEFTFGGKKYRVEKIGDYAFNNCDKLMHITIPDSVMYINKYAFSGCSSLVGAHMNNVVMIGDYAFKGCRELTSVTIPDYIKSIGKDAFSDCIQLIYNKYDKGYYLGNKTNPYVVLAKVESNDITDFTINENYRIIYGNPFSKGKNITKATIPTWTINSIPKSNLTEVVITNGTSINRDAFKDFSNLTSITIPDSVTSIGNNAFYGCKSLSAVYYKGTIEQWCNISFKAATSNPLFYAHHLYINNKLVTEIKIPDNVTNIGNYTFYGCNSLASITIPDNVTSIGNSAFDGCNNITKATIPTWAISYIPKSNLTEIIITSGTNIDDNAFRDCRSLKSITIPDSVTGIGNWAFYGCNNLSAVYYKGTIEQWCNILFKDNPVYYAHNLYIDNKLLTEIKIPDNVTNINSYAFSGCNNITKATIPTWAISYIPKSNLTEVIITSGTNIGDSAFKDYSNLTSVTIPNSVKSIDRYAFYGCTKLTSVSIPNSVTSIGERAFYNCSSLTDIYITDIANWCNISGISNLMCYGTSAKSIYLNGELITNPVIPDSVTNIESYAFYGCSSLTSVTIGNGVTGIGNSAFADCNNLSAVYYKGTIEQWCNISFKAAIYNPVYYAHNLYIDNKLVTEIEISDNVTNINSYAFSGCNNITKATIPTWAISYIPKSNLTEVIITCGTSIGDSAFKDYSNLTSITIPDSVTNIGDYAFYCCYKLVEVYNKSKLNITKGSSSNGYIGYYALDIYTEKYTTKLSTNNDGYIIYSDGNSKILVGYTGADTTITLPNNITEINKYAFCGCSNLTSIIITDRVTSIGVYAFNSLSFFDGCYNLSAVYYNGTIEQWCNISFSNEYSNPLYYAHNLYINNELVTEIKIPDNVTNINSYAFYGCSSLTSVTIPNSVKSIDRYAFYNCSKLTSVKFQNPVNWYRVYDSTNWKNKTGGTKTDLSNVSDNATYFTSTYYGYYWYKKM